MKVTNLTTHLDLNDFAQTVFIIVAIITLATNLIAAFVHERVVSMLKSNVNTGFFAKLIAFFKGLFGFLPTITQAFKETL